ncbi:MAG: hypothetical protein DLM57_02550 [Pseudonocardiales bacterium]|nr:MAG: hypothetical protein DLM57_02550 [Pseudonocardiales bacterium]
MTDPAPRRHRGLFWAGVLLALSALVGGGLFAYLAYAATAGPDGAVKGYFAALARGNAPAALGFGDPPAGAHQLLTSTVLGAQLEIAPIRHVDIVATKQTGDTATVSVRYELGFVDGSRQVSDDVKVVRRDGTWRLTRTAATTRLRLLGARDRATILGAVVSDEPLLVFPGAVPITFDTPYLRLDAESSSVKLSTPAESHLTAQVTAAGRSVVGAAVLAALRGCLAGGAHADPRCPLPAARAVPGSLRGSVTAAEVRRSATFGVAASSTGVITVWGHITLSASYAALDFSNQPVAKHGVVTLALTASTYAKDPVTIGWTQP